MHACKLLVISITELFILRYPRSTKNCLPVLKIINFQRSLDILPSNCQLCHAYWNSFKSYHWHVRYHNSWYETWFQYKFSRSFSHFSYNADIVHTFMSVGVCCSREDKVWKTQNKYVPWRGLCIYYLKNDNLKYPSICPGLWILVLDCLPGPS